MSCEAMQENLVRRLAGDLPETEDTVLERHLENCTACRAEAESLARLWDGIGGGDEPTPSARLRERFDAMLEREIAAEARRSTPLSFPAVAAPAPSRASFTPVGAALRLAAMLAFGLGLGWFFWGRGDSDVAALRDEVGELHGMVARALLDKPSVSERLQGVAYSREFSNDDRGVSAALVKALTSDPNVNVRLAALEALAPVASRDDLRPEFVALAARADAPLVSLSAIDVLLESESPAARRDLEQLLEDPKLDPVVRGYLRDRLGRRI